MPDLESDFLNQLSSIKKVNVFYAVSEVDAYRIARENRTNILIVGDLVTNRFLEQFHEKHPFVIVYRKAGNPGFIKDLKLLMDSSLNF